MSNQVFVFKELPKYLIKLYDSTGYIGNNEVKSAIAQAEKYVSQNLKNASETKVDQMIIPFIYGLRAGGQLRLISIEFLSLVFSNVSQEFLPSEERTKDILKSIINSNVSQTDELCIETSKLFKLIFEKTFKKVLSHSVLLYKSVIYVFRLATFVSRYDKYEEISKILIEINNFFIKQIKSSSETENQYSARVKTTMAGELISKDVCIFDPPFPPFTTVSEVDFAIVLLAFADSLKFDNSKRVLLSFCISLFTEFLSSDAPLLRKPFFITILNEIYIIPIVSAVSVIDKIQPQEIGGYILKIYEKVGPNSLKPICNYVKNAILPAFHVFTTAQISRVIGVLAEKPELFVDIHLHYPDEKIFETIANKLITPCETKDYPSRNGLVIVATLLKNLTVPYPMKTVFYEVGKASEPEYQMFRDKPSEAVKEFIKNGKISDSKIESITKFLFDDKKLDRYAKGYLLTIMSHDFLTSYLGNINFKEMTFFEAFKTFFGSMYIPPKQKAVDLVIAAFAKKCYHELTIAKSVDAFYFLTFNTYFLHNARYYSETTHEVRFEDFVKECSNANDGANFSEELLKEIFDGVCQEMIYPVPFVRQLMNEEQLVFAYKHEEAKVRERKLEMKDVFYIVNDMISPCKKKIFTAFVGSVHLPNCATILQSIKTCIQTLFTYAARSYDKENAAIISDYLIKKANLRNSVNPPTKEDIENSLVLIKAAITNVQYISGVWLDILQEVSAYCKQTNDQSYLKNLISVTTSMSLPQIKEFVSAIVEVAHWEIAEETPRLTMMTMFMELVQWNSDRPLFIWKEIWAPISNFITSAGSSNNSKISQLIVENLAELTVHTMRLKQQRNFHLQYLFLHPFMSIFDQQNDLVIRKMIIDCLFTLIKADPKLVRSGWDIIFQCLTLSVMENIEPETCVLIAKYAVDEAIDYMNPYLVHMIAFISLLATSSKKEEDAVTGLQLFKALGERMKPKVADPWICLLETIVACNLSPYKKVSNMCKRVIIDIFGTRHDIPDSGKRFLVDKFVSSFFSESNYQEIATILVSHEEYNKYWKDTVPLILKLAFQDKLVESSSFINLVINCKEDICSEPQFFTDTAKDALKNFTETRPLKRALEKICNEFINVESAASFFNDLLAEINKPLLCQMKEYLKIQDYGSTDKLFSESLTQHLEGDRSHLDDLIEALDFVSSLQAEEIRKFSMSTLKLIVKLILDDDSSLRNVIEPIIEKLV